jgi:hypothetical protein
MVVGLVMCAMATPHACLVISRAAFSAICAPCLHRRLPLPHVMPKIARMRVVPARPENSVHSFYNLHIVGGSEPVTNWIWIHASAIAHDEVSA